MVSEETAKRIADALERLADAAERELANDQKQAELPAQTGCWYCGADHGGLGCPAITPRHML